MKQKSYKNTLLSAIGTTVVVVALLLMFINNANKQDDAFGVLMVIAIFISVANAIWQWVKVTRQYIDVAIEEMVKDRQIMNIAIQEKIKQLQEKDI